MGEILHKACRALAVAGCKWQGCTVPRGWDGCKLRPAPASGMQRQGALPLAPGHASGASPTGWVWWRPAWWLQWWQCLGLSKVCWCSSSRVTSCMVTKARQLAPRNSLWEKSADLFITLYPPAMQCWLKITKGPALLAGGSHLFILSEMELNFDSLSAEGLPHF